MILNLPFQQTGAEWLASQPRAGLADEQGLGKSYQAILAADKAGARKIAVVAPAKLRATWQREFDEKARPDNRRRLRVMSYEEAAQVFATITPARVAGGEIQRPDVIINDEAHYLKNWRSLRTQAIYPKNYVAGATWSMSGTPMPNHPGELWTHFYYLRPELIDHMNPMQFMEKYCRLGGRDQGGNVRVLGVRDAEELRALNKKLWLRRKLKDVMPELPEMRYGEIVLDTPGDVDALRGAEIVVAGHEQELLFVDPLLLPIGDEWLATMRRMLAIAKAKPFAEFIVEELQNNPGEKIVLFGWHTEALDVMAQVFAAAGMATVMVDGRTPPSRVQERVDSFQQNPAVRAFIGQILAAGTGLTLTAANNVAFLEYSWTPTDNEQAERRILRIGQTAQSCLCRFATLRNSIDEPVMRVLARKNGMINKVME